MPLLLLILWGSIWSCKILIWLIENVARFMTQQNSACNGWKWNLLARWSTWDLTVNQPQWKEKGSIPTRPMNPSFFSDPPSKKFPRSFCTIQHPGTPWLFYNHRNITIVHINFSCDDQFQLQNQFAKIHSGTAFRWLDPRNCFLCHDMGFKAQ